MNIIVCVDEKKGMLFNKRRQSKDKLVIKDIIDNLESDLYINDYSKELFVDYMDSNKIHVVEEFNFEKDKYYFIENLDVSSYEKNISNIIIYNWNRTYPKDKTFNIDLNNYELVNTIEFVGNSHDKITKQIYKRVSV